MSSNVHGQSCMVSRRTYDMRNVAGICGGKGASVEYLYEKGANDDRQCNKS